MNQVKEHTCMHNR